MINAIIVDDELSAIESLKWEINNFCADVNVIETFTNPVEAISAINYLKPDMVFLDIEMPELDGFQMLNKLNYRDFSLIITTAYNQYAIQAFKENAIDYLLKPIDPDELVKSVAKIKKNSSENKLSSSIEKVFEKVLASKNETQKVNRVPLALSEKIVMVNDSDIMYCKADGNYTHIFMQNGEKYLLSKNIKSVESMIPFDHFLRIHKTHVVNTNYIAEYIRGDGGEVIMTNKVNIPVSRSNKKKLLEVLGIN